MSQTHDSALFINPEPGVHDGCFLYTKPRCPIKFAQWQAMIEALPVEPSERFKVMTAKMAKIQDVPRPNVIDPTKGENECKTTKLTNCSDQQLSMSSPPKPTTKLGIEDSH